jgi:hypothetical protein
MLMDEDITAGCLQDLGIFSELTTQTGCWKIPGWSEGFPEPDFFEALLLP